MVKLIFLLIVAVLAVNVSAGKKVLASRSSKKTVKFAKKTETKTVTLKGFMEQMKTGKKKVELRIRVGEGDDSKVYNIKTDKAKAAVLAKFVGKEVTITGTVSTDKKGRRTIYVKSKDKKKTYKVKTKRKKKRVLF